MNQDPEVPDPTIDDTASSDLPEGGLEDLEFYSPRHRSVWAPSGDRYARLGGDRYSRPPGDRYSRNLELTDVEVEDD